MPWKMQSLLGDELRGLYNIFKPIGDFSERLADGTFKRLPALEYALGDPDPPSPEPEENSYEPQFAVKGWPDDKMDKPTVGDLIRAFLKEIGAEGFLCRGVPTDGLCNAHKTSVPRDRRQKPDKIVLAGEGGDSVQKLFTDWYEKCCVLGFSLTPDGKQHGEVCQQPTTGEYPPEFLGGKALVVDVFGGPLHVEQYLGTRSGKLFRLKAAVTFRGDVIKPNYLEGIGDDTADFRALVYEAVPETKVRDVPGRLWLVNAPDGDFWGEPSDPIILLRPPKTKLRVWGLYAEETENYQSQPITAMEIGPLVANSYAKSCMWASSRELMGDIKRLVSHRTGDVGNFLAYVLWGWYKGLCANLNKTSVFCGFSKQHTTCGECSATQFDHYYATKKPYRTLNINRRLEDWFGRSFVWTFELELCPETTVPEHAVGATFRDPIGLFVTHRGGTTFYAGGEGASTPLRRSCNGLRRLLETGFGIQTRINDRMLTHVPIAIWNTRCKCSAEPPRVLLRVHIKNCQCNKSQE